MKRLSLIFFVALFVCLPFVTKAQLYVDSLGIVQVGDYQQDIYGNLGNSFKDTTIVLSIKGYGNNWSRGKITFGDAYNNYMMNVSVGELCDNGGPYGDDTDKLWLHAKVAFITLLLTGHKILYFIIITARFTPSFSIATCGRTISLWPLTVVSRPTLLH